MERSIATGARAVVPIGYRQGKSREFSHSAKPRAVCVSCRWVGDNNVFNLTTLNEVFELICWRDQCRVLGPSTSLLFSIYLSLHSKPTTNSVCDEQKVAFSVTLDRFPAAATNTLFTGLSHVLP